MSELVRWADRPQAPRLFVRQPHPRPCTAAQCTVPASAHLLLWDGALTIWLEEVCAGHAHALKAELGRCVVFPLDGAPPIDVLGYHFQQELDRRQRAAQAARYWQPGVYVHQSQAAFVNFTWASGPNTIWG